MSYKSIEDRRAYHRQYMKERRNLFREHGFCAECGKEDAYTMNGHYRCFECQDKRRKRPVEYIKQEKPTMENFRYDSSLCYFCGEPVMSGETLYSGKPFRVCCNHYEFMKQIAAKGRKAYKERHGETWGNYQYQLSQKKREFDNSEKFLLPYTSYSKCATRFQ